MTIRAENVFKSHGEKVVLDDLSLEVESGSFCAVLGAADAGKTTLLRVLAGIERPDKGRVFFDGQDVTGLPVQQRGIAFVYQQFVNYPSMSIYENIASPLRVGKERQSEAEITRKVTEMAELLRLREVLTHLPEEVSGGQRQRCAIARALVKGARVIFLDEPLANLDYKLREELRVELKEIFRGRQGIVVYATPEPIDALMMATHVGFLDQGRIQQYGPAKEVYQHPRQASVASYFSHPQMNLFESDVETANERSLFRVTDELGIEVGLNRDQLPRKRYLLGIRPHHLSLSREDDLMAGFPCEVELAEVVGSNTELHLRHKDLRMTLLMQRVERFAVGQKVTSYIDPRHLYVFDVDSREFVTRTN